jgi:gliding motility-associated-like protein
MIKYSVVILLLLGTLTLNAQVNLSNGLIGCYPFSGNAQDLGGSNNHGRVNGAQLTKDRFGNANSAYDFDGIDDYIEINSKDLQLNEFSYSFWMYPRKLPQYQQAFFIFSIGSSLGDQYVLIGNQYPDVLHGISNGSYLGVYYNVRCMTNELPKLNEWYHVVLAKDSENYYFYVNGTLLCTNPTNGSTAFYGVGTVKATIGARNNYRQAVDAIIDDIHLYDRAINQSEVDELFKGISTIKPEHLTLTQNNPSPCGGDAIQVTADEIGGGTYYWKIDGIEQPLTSTNFISYTLPDRKAEYEIRFEVEISNPISCFPLEPAKQEKTITVRSCTPTTFHPTLVIPTVFTPNRDGKNDEWEIFNIDLYPKLEISVFNRWGELIFKSNGYDKPWDGTYQGQTVANGVYPYNIHSNGRLIRQGVVTVIY